MKLKDSLNNRLLVKQAKVFLVLILVIWALVTLVSTFTLFSNSHFDATTKLSMFLNIQLLLLIVFLMGQLLLLFGIFWWEKIEWVKE